MDGEEGFPQSRGEFVDAGCGVLAHALQDIDQVVVRVDLVQPAGHDQALYDAYVLSPRLCPTE